MKTTPMDHQIRGLQRLREGGNIFAMGAEQGTGKTWMLLADTEERFNNGEIDGLLVIAPKGVHVNWVRREIPKHLEAPNTATFWRSGAGVGHTRILTNQLREKGNKRLQIHCMNIDAVNTKAGYDHAVKFLQTFTCSLIVDESQRIKNMDALRTKRVFELGRYAKVRRISSGTIVANSPLDLYSQYHFLAPGLLGTTSYRAYVAEFAELLPPSSPLVQDIIARTRGRGVPQVVARDKHGIPKYKNLDKLRSLIAPHTFRVLKSECLDLPPKIYENVYFELEPAQRRLYEEVKKDRRWYREDGEIDSFTALTVIHKLRQITSGFVLVDGEATHLAHGGARMAALLEAVEDVEGGVIVWASFREELSMIAEKLSKIGPVVSYHGGTSAKDREAAVDAFQSGAAKFFVANPAAAGTGLTLTAAKLVVYYSSSYSLEERTQSEDRAHRIGTEGPVVYVDIVGEGTIDERIAAALQAKESVAAEIMLGL